MRCERCCEQVAVEHVAVREGDKIRELHLCRRCSNADAEMVEMRQRARLTGPKAWPRNVHHFIQLWEARRRSLGRELSKEELFQLLDSIGGWPGSHNPPMQRTVAACIVCFLRKLLRRGPGR
jgi:hypothetical protein